MSSNAAAMLSVEAMAAFNIPFFSKTATTTVVRAVEPAALSPLVFLPFHLASHHMTARVFPHKHITYPLNLAFTLVQFAVEHYTSSVPSLAALNAALVNVALLVAVYHYRTAFKQTVASKRLIWAGLALFLGGFIVFKGIDVGVPKDDPNDQIVANEDRTHSLWHLGLHVLLLVSGCLTSYGVPWARPESKKLELAVPSSPAHTTRSPNARSFKAAWPKPAKLE